jgi:hypothetical protein
LIDEGHHRPLDVELAGHGEAGALDEVRDRTVQRLLHDRRRVGRSDRGGRERCRQRKRQDELLHISSLLSRPRPLTRQATFTCGCQTARVGPDLAAVGQCRLAAVALWSHGPTLPHGDKRLTKIR